METIQIGQALLPLDERALVCLAAAGVFFVIAALVGWSASMERGGGSVGLFLFGLATIFSLACAYTFTVGWLGLLITVLVGIAVLALILQRKSYT